METYDYVNTTTRSLSRPLTVKERNALKKARAAWHRLPRDPHTKAENAATRGLVASLYEDGASRQDISDVTGWSVLSISQMIRLARMEGSATGRRRYLAPPVVEHIPAPPQNRPLTAKEGEWLTKQAARLPKTARGFYRWDNPIGDKVVAKVIEWTSEEPPVTHEDIAQRLGVARQAIAVLLNRHAGRTRQQIVKVNGMTDAQFHELSDAFAAARPWGANRIRWASADSQRLIKVLADLYFEGLSVSQLAQAMSLEENSVRNGLAKSAVTLRPEDALPLGATTQSLRLPDPTVTTGRTVSKRSPAKKAAAKKTSSTVTGRTTSTLRTTKAKKTTTPRKASSAAH